MVSIGTPDYGSVFIIMIETVILVTLGDHCWVLVHFKMILL